LFYSCFNFGIFCEEKNANEKEIIKNNLPLHTTQHHTTMAHKKGFFFKDIEKFRYNSKQKSITATVTKYVCNHFDRYRV